MTILQTIPQVVFSENIPDIVVGDIPDGDTVRVSSILDGTTLFSEMEFIPDKNHQIAIRSRQLANNLASLSGPSSAVRCSLSQLTIKFATNSISCRLVPGGIDPNVADISYWLTHNFLTWQPQTIETTYRQPQQLSYVGTQNNGAIIYTRLYTKDGLSFTKPLGSASSSAVYLYNFAVGYTDIWEEFCTEKGLVPLCYEVYGIENMPFVQRYQLRKQQPEEVCVGFVNTLGGFDTLMMQGLLKLLPEGKNKTFVSNGSETELSNDYTSFWEASTGYIDSRRMAAQYQDFLKSTNRWIFKDGQWFKIIVDEYTVEDSPLELNAYTFKFHLAQKNEHRFYARKELPTPSFPTEFFTD